MCRLLGLIGVPPLPVGQVLDAFLPLSKEGHVKCTMTPGHLDGWGISGYSGGRAVYFERRADPATDAGELFQKAKDKAQLSQTRVLIAHLRKASAGVRDLRNTHPFHCRDWIFAHNGTLFNVSALPLIDNQPQGQTDSEHFMLWLLEQVRNEEDVTEALVNVLKEWREKLVFSSLTFILTDGKTLWAYRDYGDKNFEAGETLAERDKYYTLYTVRVGQCDILCSEPLKSVAPSWRPLLPRTLMEFSLTKPAPRTFSI